MNTRASWRRKGRRQGREQPSPHKFSVSPHGHPEGCLLLVPFSTEGNRSFERSGDLAKVTQPVRNGTQDHWPS